jgi:hypothetical protein
MTGVEVLQGSNLIWQQRTLQVLTVFTSLKTRIMPLEFHGLTEKVTSTANSSPVRATAVRIAKYVRYSCLGDSNVFIE